MNDTQAEAAMQAVKRAPVAKAYLVAVEIRCPGCDREDPIPARDGSFMWDALPEEVTCPDCGRTFKVSKRVEV
jgi:rubredoxin